MKKPKERKIKAHLLQDIKGYKKEIKEDKELLKDLKKPNRKKK